MHEPLEGIAAADARPRAAVPAARGAAAARALGRRGAGRRARGGGRLEPRRHARRRARAPRALRRPRAAAASATCPARGDAARRRTAIAVRTARAARGAAVAAARRPSCAGSATACTCGSPRRGRGSSTRCWRWRVRCRVAAHWAGACIATSSWGWPGGALLALSVFLPWYGTDPDNRFAQIDGARGDSVLLGRAPDPALAAARRRGGAVHPRLHHRHATHKLSWARGEMTMVTSIAAFGLIFYNGVDRPARRALERDLAEVRLVPGAARRRCVMIVGVRHALLRARARPQAPGNDLVTAHARLGPDPPRPQPRARARARDRGRRARRRAPRSAWATRRPPTRPPSTPCALVLDTVHMDGIVVIGEGEKDEAPMLYNGEQHRRRLAARGRHRRRPARGHARWPRKGMPERAGRHRAQPARDDVRPRARASTWRRSPAAATSPTCSTSTGRWARRCGLVAERRGVRHPRHHGRRPRPPAPRGGHPGDPRRRRARAPHHRRRRRARRCWRSPTARRSTCCGASAARRRA